MTGHAHKRAHPGEVYESVVEAEASSSKKSKGRPRVMKQDESAADRRRTQIRLAQRAYRQRKENTISALQDQVSSLHSTIERLNEEFLHFQHKLLSSAGFLQKADLVQELRAAGNRIDLLVKASQTVPSGSEGESERESAQEDRLRASRRVTQSHSRTPPGASGETQLPLGYVRIYDESAASSRHGGIDTPPEVTSIASNLQSLSTGPAGQLSNAAQQSTVARVSRPGPADLAMRIPPTIVDAPYVFSAHESTFLRRLQRAGLEKAFHLMCKSASLPKLFQKTFQLTLLTESREQLMNKARNALKKSVFDPIDFYRTPFFHLGGAGLHYGKPRGENSFMIHRKEGEKIARIWSAEEDPDVSTEIELDLENYDDVWFDPVDVDGYLNSIGVMIGPRENFAEIVVLEVSPLADMLRDVGKMPPLQKSQQQNMHMGRPTVNDGTSQNSYPAVSMAPMMDLGFGDLGSLGNMAFANDASGWLMGAGDVMPDMMSTNWNSMQYTDMWNVPEPALPQPSRTVTLDVNLFLDNVIRGGMCLGRVPGFQRKSVQKALVTAIIQVS